MVSIFTIILNLLIKTVNSKLLYSKLDLQASAKVFVVCQKMPKKFAKTWLLKKYCGCIKKLKYCKFYT